MSTLTVAEFREVVKTSLSNEAIQLLIDAAEAQVTAIAGPVGSTVEEHFGGGEFILLNHFADAITSIREADATVDLVGTPDNLAEYRLRSDGRSIERIVPTYSQYSRWYGPVTVTYEPKDLAALRKVATIQLIKGTIANNPGVLGMTEGNFSIQFANGETWASVNDDALSQIEPPWSFG